MVDLGWDLSDFYSMFQALDKSVMLYHSHVTFTHVKCNAVN